MNVAKRLEGIQEYYFSKKLREIDEMNKAGKSVINLGIGSPDLPPHPDVINELIEKSKFPNLHGYQSYKGLPVFRNAIANWYQKWYNVALNPDTEILPLMGSKEGIMHICMTYLNEGDAALVPNPGYPTYASNVRLTGAQVLEYKLKEENDWYPDFDTIEKMNLSNVKLMFVNYPHMPTGKEASKSVFQRIIDFGKKNNITIVHDNPYSFILNENPQSIMSIEGAKDVVIELNSLSKSHNMAGWRLGMMVADYKKINEVMRFKSNMDSGMFAPLQYAAAKALDLNKEWYVELNKTYKSRRILVSELLEVLECTYDKNQVGLFMWAKIPEHYDNCYEIADDILYKANVFLTPGGIFGNEGDRYIRISLCGNEQRFRDSIERIKNAKSMKNV